MLIFPYAIELLQRYYQNRGYDPSVVLDLKLEDVESLQGFDGLNRFIQTLFLTSGGLKNGIPEGYGYEFFRLATYFGYGFDPNYGQVPTPPEETPIAQSPYQITQLPTPENP